MTRTEAQSQEAFQFIRQYDRRDKPTKKEQSAKEKSGALIQCAALSELLTSVSEDYPSTFIRSIKPRRSDSDWSFGT